MAGIALSITGRSRISWENWSIQVTASVSLSILRFGEEKGRERVICCFIYGLILICAFSREILSIIAFSHFDVLKEGFNFKLIYICRYINIRC